MPEDRPSDQTAADMFYTPDPNYLDPNAIPVTTSDLIVDSRELRVHSVVDESKYFTLFYRPGNYTLDMYKSAQRLIETDHLELENAIDHLLHLVDEWDLKEWVDREETEIDRTLPESTRAEQLVKYKKLATVPITRAGLGRQGIGALGHILMRIMLDIRGRREEATLGKLEPATKRATNVVPMDGSTKRSRTKATRTQTTTRGGAATPERKQARKPRSARD